MSRLDLYRLCTMVIGSENAVTLELMQQELADAREIARRLLEGGDAR